MDEHKRQDKKGSAPCADWPVSAAAAAAAAGCWLLLLLLPVQLLVAEGKIKYVGLSEVGPKQIRWVGCCGELGLPLLTLVVIPS